jgi:hypothetical protein
VDRLGRTAVCFAIHVNLGHIHPEDDVGRMMRLSLTARTVITSPSHLKPSCHALLVNHLGVEVASESNFAPLAQQRAALFDLGQTQYQPDERAHPHARARLSLLNGTKRPLIAQPTLKEAKAGKRLRPIEAPALPLARLA